MKNIQKSIEHIKVRMKGIEEQIGIFTTTITQTQTRISAMEKDVYKNNLMENKVKQLEKYNMEMEKSMSEKFDELEGKIKRLEAHKETIKDSTENATHISSEKQNFTSQFDDLKCFICKKHFRNTTLLGIHDKRFHLEKGTALYKCDNCNERFEDKMQLVQHITTYHVPCSICKKVFPTSSSLSDHFTAVHDKLKLKHTIEREASLRIHKVKRFNSRV